MMVVSGGFSIDKSAGGGGYGRENGGGGGRCDGSRSESSQED